MDKYIAHISNNGNIQTLKEHSQNVAEMASLFGESLNMKDILYYAGYMHDWGKSQEGFQNYIQSPSLSPKTPHALYGAIVAYRMLQNHKLSPIISLLIMAHHAGLSSFDDIKEKIIKSSDGIKLPQISLPEPALHNIKNEHLITITRLLFSCLTDADYLDTQYFMYPRTRQLGNGETLDTLWGKFNTFIGSNILPYEHNSKLNELRCAILRRCINVGQTSNHVYNTLTVPTGGGKTISCMGFALLYAIKHKLDRIIIAIPYMTIISQTTSVYRAIFGFQNVIEVDSNFDVEDLVDNNLSYQDKLRLKLLSENFSGKIVVTTDVQLIESMFSNKPGKCRKLHNFANSLIVFDEVQKLPLSFTNVIYNEFAKFNELMNTRFLFMSATMPYVDKNWAGLQVPCDFNEIIPQHWDLENRLRRNTINCLPIDLDIALLGARLHKEKNVLCIVNSKYVACLLFEHMVGTYHEDVERIYHLSKNMCNAHIQEVLKEVNNRLRDNLPTILISTNLIEAGVDIDFTTVYKEKDGNDSIKQAAGRCNREGKNHIQSSMVYVFSFDKSIYINRTNKLTKKNTNNDVALSKKKNAHDLTKNINWFGKDVIKEYFKCVYRLISQIDISKMKSWEEIAKKIKLINNEQFSVLIPYNDESTALIKDYNNMQAFTCEKRRLLAKYSVPVDEVDRDKLLNTAAISEINETTYILTNMSLYNKNTGLNTDSTTIIII